jgi:branched-chain amino acid transport system substrate-binding protein
MIRNLLATCALSCALATPAFAADPGVTDSSIKLGQTMPYSGPASAYSVVGKSEAAYFRMLNDKGGINGRKIELISLDDGYSPPKTVEQIRKLVEQEEVFAIVGSLGTPTNVAVQKYLNLRKVPQIMPFSGASRWNDAKNFPWTTGSQPSYVTEGAIYGKWIVANNPAARIAIITPNDDSGRDFLRGFKQGLGDHAGQIVAQAIYETTDPTIDSQIVTFKSAGADVFFNECTPKFAAMALKKAAEIGWNPQIILPTLSNSVNAVLKPLGLDKAKGVVTGAYMKDPTDPRWADDADMKTYRDFMTKYVPSADIGDSFNVSGYVFGQIAALEIQRMGNDISRENFIRQAQSLRDVSVPMLLPGIKINTSPEQVTPIRQLQMARFDGTSWVLFGDVIGE